MNTFLSCDWGTTSFRLRLVDIKEFKILAEESSDQGIAVAFGLWNESVDKARSRQSFCLNIINEHIKKIESGLGVSLAYTNVIISGMASSTIGILELPYQNLPFNTDGTDAEIRCIEASSDFEHDVYLISGVKSENDIMRGEETQLIGCFSDFDNNYNECLFVFPGTHSKHIQVIDRRMVSFKTYMTGEFFALLSTKSILSQSVQKSREHSHHGLSPGFEAGVKDSLATNLLQAAFNTRTNSLFNKLSLEENYNYLSGLLIGTELKDLLNVKTSMMLCCSSNLMYPYQTALHMLGIADNVYIFPEEKLDMAVVKGQLHVFNCIKMSYEKCFLATI